MAGDPKVSFELPADYLARFPDGDYTVGRGADPRMAAEQAADQDGRVASAQALKAKASTSAGVAVAVAMLTETAAKSHETSKAVASKAGKIMHDPKASKAARAVAASALTQHSRDATPPGPRVIQTRKSAEKK